MITDNNNVVRRRKQKKWSSQVLLFRVLWAFCKPIFRWSPRLCWGFRRCLLRAFGAKIGEGTNIYPSVHIIMPSNLEIGSWSTIGDGVNLYALGRIQVGDEVTISQGAHLCAGTHDFQDPLFTLIKSDIVVGSHAWVCADAFIGPDVNIGGGAVVAARAVVVKDVSGWMVVGGNPAREIKRREMKDTQDKQR